MGARSRRKGAKWERHLAGRLKAVGIDAERNLTECRTGNAGDLVIPPDVPLTVQAKVGARPPIYEAVAEAVEARRPGDHPVALIRRNGRGSAPPTDLAVLPLDSFLELVRTLRDTAWRTP